MLASNLHVQSICFAIKQLSTDYLCLHINCIILYRCILSSLLFTLLFPASTRKCPPIHNPLHGIATLGDSEAIYRCTRGFKLIGSRRRLCDIKGQWIGSEPVCKWNYILLSVFLFLSGAKDVTEIVERNNDIMSFLSFICKYNYKGSVLLLFQLLF